MTDSPPRPRSGALPIFAVLAVAIAAGAGFWLAQRLYATPEVPALQGSLLYPAPRPVPAFSLDGPEGGKFDESMLQGRWSLVFVGFTHCPDVCPTTLALLGGAFMDWPATPPSARPQVIFVSVDPERDSVDKVAEYARFYDPAFLAATADHDRLLPFTRSLGMVYMQTPLEGGDYTVDHSSSLAILNPQGQLVGVMRPPLDPARISADMHTLMESTP